MIGLTTPDWLSTINTQKELNVHNLFTDYFNSAYFVVGLAFFATYAVTFIIQLGDPCGFRVDWLPHPFLLPLAALTAAFSFHIEANEFVEQLSVFFVVLYALQLSYLVHHRAKPPKP